MKVGSLVKYRERDWVVLPSEDPNIISLRPIAGSGREVCNVFKPLTDLLGYSLPYERVEPSRFPLPDASSVQDHAAVRLLMEGARLLLREGAAPFRSVGHVSVRPRPYQFVPLLMALRLPTIRLLIADDVGVGKTIEAGLIAREMLDRGEIRRLAVLCPPYLCDQWQKELAEKFHIDAPIVQSGTVSRLERQASPDRSIFGYFPHLVVSIDLAKGERYRASFLQYCPDLVIVDEVHGAAQPRGQRAAGQQQRHELLKALARQQDRHLILLSATPHSGVEESFLSILGLIKPKFQNLDLDRLEERDRIELARHFVQRRRGDIRRWLGPDTFFPEREKEERPYEFSPEFRQFYNDVYKFASGLVKSAEALKGWKRRMRFWSALALLRCVASSPAAAEAALEKRAGSRDETMPVAAADESLAEESLDAAFEPVVYDPLEAECSDDAPPSSVFDLQEQDQEFDTTDRRRLRDFARRAVGLRGEADTKLEELVRVTLGLLRERLHPIVWCRYIATADYVAQALDTRLRNQFPNLRVVSITGALSDEERRLKVEDLATAKCRVLVATDCLSEGINLQKHFNAVIHYDLPWNPNRLEQREGRVDRFMQTAAKVKAVLIFGQDNPVDGAVLQVLLRKANTIYHRLGIHVPVPTDSESVMEAVLRSLFSRSEELRGPSAQLRLPELDSAAKGVVEQLHQQMDRAAEREKASRTRFAQHAIQREEIGRELEETDRVLGTPDDVRRFLVDAGQRLGFSLRPLQNGVWEFGTAGLPATVRARLANAPSPWRIAFDSPTPEDVTFVGRNHPLVEALAEHLFDLAFHPAGRDMPASRCGVIRTGRVTRRTTLLLLRVRYLVYERKEGQPALAEETLPWGFEGLAPNITPLPLEQSRQLLDSAAADRNMAEAEKREILEETLAQWNGSQEVLRAVLDQRTQELTEAHQRIRQLLGQRKIRIEPQMPPDLLGVLVLVPIPRGS